MICKKCGEEIGEWEVCPKCGAATKADETPKVNKIRAVIIIFSALLVVGVILGVLQFAGIPVFSDSDAKYAVIKAEIDNKIQKVEDKYKDTDGYIPEEDKDKAISEVLKLAEEKLQNGTILYYEQGLDCVYMKLLDGTGYVYLPNIQGINSAGSTLKIATLQPFNEEFSNELSNDALKGTDVAARKIVDFSAAYSFSSDGSGSDDDFDDAEVTIEALKNFSSYSIIIWEGHGGYSDTLHSFIVTGVESSSEIKNMYKSDFEDQSLIDVSNGHVAATSRFFEKYLGKDSLKGSLIYLGTCSSGVDAVLADTFIEKGASTVYANTGIIYIVYNNSMIKSILGALTSNNDEYVTAAEALSAAQKENKKYDHYGTEETHYTEVRIFGDSNYTLKVVAPQTEPQYSETPGQQIEPVQPPEKPLLVSPGDRSTFTGSAPMLKWDSVASPSGGQVKYYAEIFDCPSPQNSGWITGISWTPSATTAGLYNWRVKAIDINTGKESGFGVIWQYTIDAKQTAVPKPDQSPSEVAKRCFKALVEGDSDEALSYMTAELAQENKESLEYMSNVMDAIQALNDQLSALTGYKTSGYVYEFPTSNEQISGNEAHVELKMMVTISSSNYSYTYPYSFDVALTIESGQWKVADIAMVYNYGN